MLIGLTGPNAAGKGAVANHLTGQGFAYLSLSDVLREELTGRGIRIDREALVAIGNELRETEGPGVLAARILEKISGGGSYVVDSIRHPAEVEVLRRRSDFHLVLVNAPVRTRFERTTQRGRENDPTDFEAFLDLERHEFKGDADVHQQLALTMALADYTIENDGSLPELEMKVDLMVSDFESRDRGDENDD